MAKSAQSSSENGFQILINTRNSAIQPFFQQDKHFFLIFSRYFPALIQGIMMTKLVIRINTPVKHYRPVISWSDVNMNMRIGVCIFVNYAHPCGMSRAHILWMWLLRSVKVSSLEPEQMLRLSVILKDGHTPSIHSWITFRFLIFRQDAGHGTSPS